MKEQLVRADYLGILTCLVARGTILILSELTEVLVGREGACIHLTPEISVRWENI